MSDAQINHEDVRRVRHALTALASDKRTSGGLVEPIHAATVDGGLIEPDDVCRVLRGLMERGLSFGDLANSGVPGIIETVDKLRRAA